MTLNIEDPTLAESKILLLYIINKVGKPISDNELLELVTSVVEINYFYYKQFLDELIEDKFIEKIVTENSDLYTITNSGKNAIELTISTIPGILKLQVDSKFKENLVSIKDKYSISAEYMPISEKEFSVRCKIIENNLPIFDLQFNAGSKNQAKIYVENWNKNAGAIYPQLLEILGSEIPENNPENEENNTENNKN